MGTLLMRPEGEPRAVVLFAVGAAGDPGRHAPTLERLAAAGLLVVAPPSERLASSFPTADELSARARRLADALTGTLAEAGREDLPVVGVGHSIGATTLLALAGGELWLGQKDRVKVALLPALDHLVLLTPATGFFRAPGALDRVSVPALVWAAAEDDVTPADGVTRLAEALRAHVPVELRVADGAGHFAFMDDPPPGVTDRTPDRQPVLDELVEVVVEIADGTARRA
ncbi:hypothetical protein [Nocardioides solisilvae]|uniref:hypothetical protein n=1 Tax=Nocardioides solisilvae TaxID=1542435 RepID=UPI000D744BFC|nr:hypothetical protein [Nocardioides solisilvae]